MVLLEDEQYVFTETIESNWPQNHFTYNWTCISEHKQRLVWYDQWSESNQRARFEVCESIVVCSQRLTLVFRHCSRNHITNFTMRIQTVFISNVVDVVTFFYDAASNVIVYMVTV